MFPGSLGLYVMPGWQGGIISYWPFMNNFHTFAPVAGRKPSDLLPRSLWPGVFLFFDFCLVQSVAIPLFRSKGESLQVPALVPLAQGFIFFGFDFNLHLQKDFGLSQSFICLGHKNKKPLILRGFCGPDGTNIFYISFYRSLCFFPFLQLLN
jgi:hypothetical protein